MEQQATSGGDKEGYTDMFKDYPDMFAGLEWGGNPTEWIEFERTPLPDEHELRAWDEFKKRLGEDEPGLANGAVNSQTTSEEVQRTTGESDGLDVMECDDGQVPTGEPADSEATNPGLYTQPPPMVSATATQSFRTPEAQDTARVAQIAAKIAVFNAKFKAARSPVPPSVATSSKFRFLEPEESSKLDGTAVPRRGRGVLDLQEEYKNQGKGKSFHGRGSGNFKFVEQKNLTRKL